jgi:hypothetical protein
VADSESVFDPLFRIFSTTPGSPVEGANSVPSAIAIGLDLLHYPGGQICIHASDRVSAADRQALAAKAWIFGLVVVEDYPAWVRGVLERIRAIQASAASIDAVKI